MKNTYSPDILNCLANLSSDEVFTSPELANRMLDLLPQELFRSSKTRFLDPCSKSGVFLREIAKRLLTGLEEQIPDLQQRIDHIMTKQVFGIACTDLTAEMSRRTLYCTKQANGEYSVTTAFHDVQGNLRYSRCNHIWNAQDRCEHCGASKDEYQRTDNCETYAYPFIHKPINEIFKNNMQFDVIIGNPPYQLSDGGNRNSASPIYQLFVEQAKKLKPRYLIMIIPSRWYCGGRDLSDFRDSMLKDGHLKYLYDYKYSKDCFPGIRAGGGICYFLWDISYNSDLVDFEPNGEEKTVRKKLDYGLDFFIRDNMAVRIVEKVKAIDKETMASRVWTQKPFGFRTNYEEFKPKGEVKLYTKKSNTGYGFVSKKDIEKNAQFIDYWKVVTSRSTSVPEEDNGQVLRISQTFIAEPNSVVTESYVVIDAFKEKELADNCMSYVKTKFFRYLCQPTIVSPDVSNRTFVLVPLQDFSHPWTNEMLYKKYNLDKDEIAFIESMIRPME